jgi:hypothetical protein
VLDVRNAQTTLENLVRDAILYALGVRLPAVASVAALRAVASRGASSTVRTDDDLICIVADDEVTGSFRWSSTSAASDNGTTVIKPTDVVSGPGRWLRWDTDLRLAPTVGGNSYALHEFQTGCLKKVLVIDKDYSQEEILALIGNAVPSVIIDADGDDPESLTQITGHRYDTQYRFKVSVYAENLRDRRQAAQGSAVAGDTDPGANTIDGWIKALLGGMQLSVVQDGIRNVVPGPCENLYSELMQRRVVRQRLYTLLVTEEYPAAPNDTTAAEEIDAQAEFAALHDQDEADPDNFVVSGIVVVPGTGLSKFVTSGTAYMSGTEVSYVSAAHTFTANTDTYRDLLSNGTLTFVEVPAGTTEPAVTANAMRIGVTRTDATSVTDDRYIAAVKYEYMNPAVIPI